MIDRLAFLAGLIVLPGCAAPAYVATVAAGAAATYSYAKDANTGLEVTEDVVCGVWGAHWKGNVPDNLTGWREDVALFCSGDPAIGSTPEATLVDLWTKVKAIRAAKLAQDAP